MAGLSIALLAVLIGGVGGTVHTALDRRKSAQGEAADENVVSGANPQPTARPAPAPTAMPEYLAGHDDTSTAPTAVTEQITGGPNVSRPPTLDAPRDGAADDLTRIRGVGQKLAEALNTMGYWHFDQIAAWSEDEVAWVDENLPRFKGRVSRDKWALQARELVAAHGAPADD